MKLILHACLILWVHTGIYGQRWIPKQKLVNQNRQSLQGFGNALAVQGDYVFVGIEQESYDSSNANPVPGSGSVRIYKRNTSGKLELYQVLHASPRVSMSRFGHHVAVKNNQLIVGAWEETIGDSSLVGAAYVFKKINNYWQQVAKLVAPDGSRYDYFGSNVAITDSFAIVSARYDNQDSAGNNPVLWAGSAYLFQQTQPGQWTFIRKITPSNRDSYTSFFGAQVVMSDSVAIISAHATNYQGTPLGRSQHCYYYALQPDGRWIEKQIIRHPNPLYLASSFGESISLHEDYLLVGSYQDESLTNPFNSAVGSCYLYRKVNDQWTLVQQIQAFDGSTNDNFGWKVSLSAAGAAVGVPNEDDDQNGNNSITSAGSVYTYKWQNDSLLFFKKIVAPDRAANKSAGDLFGYTVAISSDMLLVNAWNDDEDEQNINPLSNAGSIYMFDSVCVTETVDITATICKGDSLVWNQTVYKDSGTYLFNLINLNGCDSTIQLKLNVNTPNTIVTLQDQTLTAEAEDAVYQWIDCSTQTPFEGANQRVFSPTQSGSFAVIITQDGCKDTSECFTFEYVGLSQVTVDNTPVIYPNPFTDEFVLTVKRDLEIAVYTVLGEELYTGRFSKGRHSLSWNNLPSGVYYLRLGESYLKIVKQ